MNFTKRCIYNAAFILLLLGAYHSVLSQNIVPNPDFEVYTDCPESFGTGDFLPAIPWQNANMGSSDYFHACGLQDWTTVPHNSLGYEEAHSGVAYAGGFYLSNDFREYLQTPFTEPMDPAYNYLVSFYVNMAEDVSGCGIADFGVYFSNTPLMDADDSAIPVTPQLTTNGEYFTDTAGWMLFTACYSPVGGEQWMTIGNFNSDINTPVDPACMGVHTTYYFIDDVYVFKGGNLNGIDVELGDAVTACNTYTIDPDLSGVSYLWNNGSTGPVLTVTESGVYRVTVSDGCMGGIDSITIEITNGASISIGPDMHTMCEGDTYQVLLDPGLGDYIWQDGSNATSYDIVEAGVYHVTLDDGACISSDTIEVEVDIPPASFSLGDDATLCMGENIIIDPALTGVAFLWQDGSTDPSFLATTTGEISLTVQNACGDASDTMHVLFIDPPLPFDLGADTTLCSGESLLLEAPQTGMLIMWQDGSNEPFYLANQSQVYSLTLSNECGEEMDELMVDVDLNEIDSDFDAVIGWCPGESILLNVQQSFDADYLWNTGAADHEIQVNEPGSFFVTISAPCDQVIRYFDVIPDPTCTSNEGAFVPDVFSPNNDGFNDVFVVELGPDVEIINFQCEIFDRWGNKVFYANSYPLQWDGSFRGVELNPGVYVYSITITHAASGNEETKPMYGSLTLIR